MLDRIKERKLAQWVVAYSAAAFVVVSGLEVITEAFPSWNSLLQTAIVLAFAGLPIVIVIGWFHGEQGRQRVSSVEVGLIAAIVVVAGVLTWQFDVYGSETATEASENLPALDLDSTRLAVLPFRRDPGMPAADEELPIHSALADWTGIEVVDHLRVREVAPRENSEPRQTALAMGAGRYVDGSVTRTNPGTRLSVGLFDTRSGHRIAVATARVPSGQPVSDTAAARIARELLFPLEWGLSSDHEIPLTHSYSARTAFVAGMEALDRWRLVEADSLFGLAAVHDPQYARALLWRAQVRTWDGHTPDELSGLVETALAQPGRLSRREERMARALRHMARDQFADACAVYDTLRTLDDRDFAAWYGLGECRARDPVVLPDPESPSGWALRSSYRQAVLAYRRAFELLPAIYGGISRRTFEQVGKRLRVSTGALWPGRALPPDTLLFLARPSLLDDTLAFVPFPAADVMAGQESTRAPTFRAAVERQRRLYNDIAERWAAAFPEDREALAALAHTREMIADPRALETLDAAMARTEDPDRRLLMAGERVNLLVKFGSVDQLRQARTLADSVLAVARPASTSEFQRLSVTAALVGRPHLAAGWAARGAEEQELAITLPVAVRSPVEALTVYAAFGVPTDSIVAYERAVQAAIQTRIPPGEREAARALLVVRAASLAHATSPLRTWRSLAEQSRYPALAAGDAHAHGRHGDALRILAEARERRSRNDIQPSEISYDALFPESWLWAQLGDTATAIVMLDGTLNTRRWSEPGSLSHPARAAALIQAMALRAELADAIDDPVTARRWAAAVDALWGDADPVLRPVTDRMRRILAETTRELNEAPPEVPLNESPPAPDPSYRDRR